MDEQMDRIDAAMDHLVDAWAQLRGPCQGFSEDHPLTLARRAVADAQHSLAVAREYVLETRISVKTQGNR